MALALGDRRHPMQHEAGKHNGVSDFTAGRKGLTCGVQLQLATFISAGFAQLGYNREFAPRRQWPAAPVRMPVEVPLLVCAIGLT